MLARLANLRCIKTAVVILVVSMLVALSASSVTSLGQERRQDVQIGGVQFTPPPSFKVEHSHDTRVAFMRHSTSPIGLFVATPNGPVDDQYIIYLSNHLAVDLLHGDDGFSWKVSAHQLANKVSTHQTGSGITKGLNAKTFIQADYIILKLKGHEIVVGLIATFGDEREARFLFEVEGREYSITGWQSLFQLLPSVSEKK